MFVFKKGRCSMSVNFVNIPTELKQNASFCLWKKEKRGGRVTKVPYNPHNGTMAKTNDASTFSDFSTAMKAYAMGGWDGIGFRVSEGIGAIDIDHCIREDGTLNDVAASILGFFPDSYFERSPSGTGLRGFFKLSPDFAYDKTVYYINNRKHGLEVYEVSTKAAFRVYSKWADEMNYRPENYKNFRAAMEKAFSVKIKRPIAGGEKISMILGARLREEEAGSEEEEGEVFKPLTDEQCKI